MPDPDPKPSPEAAARRTLERMGYYGGELWKPPMGLGVAPAYPRQSDADAVASEWQAVRNDIKEAVEKATRGETLSDRPDPDAAANFRKLRWSIVICAALPFIALAGVLLGPKPPNPMRDHCLSEPGRVYQKTLAGEHLCLHGERMP